MRLIAGASLTASFDRYFNADLATLSSAHALRQDSPRRRAYSTSCLRPGALTIFCVDLLHHLELEVSVGNHLLEARILGLQGLQLLGVRHLHLPEPPPPHVDRLLAHSVLLGHLRDRRPVRLAQDLHHLLFAEPTLLHGSSGFPEGMFSGFSWSEKRQAGHPRRALPSYFLATSSRYQRKIVSGVAIVATSAKAFRPSFLPSTASCRRSASVNRSRFLSSRSMRARFTVFRYSIRSAW